MSRNLRSIIPTERQSQRTVVQYVRTKYPDVLIFAIPNGGSRNKIEAANLKKDGVLAGVPDLFIAKQKYEPYFYDADMGNNQRCRVTGHKVEFGGLFIEMKSQKGMPSIAQRMVMFKLEEAGYKAAWCRSADAAIKVIDEYLG